MTSTAIQPTRRATIISGLGGLLAGSFAANALPHLYFGLARMDNMTPFGNPSSPVVNLVWGVANIAIAAAAAKMGSGRGAASAFAIAGVCGAIGTIASLVILWA